MALDINNINNYNLFTNYATQIKSITGFSRSINVPSSTGDTYTTVSELAPYISMSAVREMIDLNPKVNKILRENGLKADININELTKLANGHLRETKNIAAGIINNLPSDLKQKIDRQAVIKAALFHDFGKVLIPDNILNKKSMLNDKERHIMELHSELGYELLKTQDLSKKTLDLIKYHHQDKNNTGYPLNDNNWEYGLESEILALADKYSALLEKRSYKPAMTPQEALKIIIEESDDSEILRALISYTKQTMLV